MVRAAQTTLAPLYEPLARQAVLAYLEPYGLGERVANRVEVILEELVSNVVRHSVGATQVAVSADATRRNLVMRSLSTMGLLISEWRR